MKKIVVVGVGALGSHFLLFSRNFEATFSVIDYDRVEQKNIMSQFHTKMSLGKNKSQSLQQSLTGLFGIKINSIPHKLTKDNDKQLLGGADLIVDCLDNAEARNIVQKFARENKISCVHGALSAGGDFGAVIWDQHFKIDAEDNAGQATCEDGEHLPFITLVSSGLAQAVKTFLQTGEEMNFHITPSSLRVP